MFEEEEVTAQKKEVESESAPTKWETYDSSPVAITERIPVEGGHIYYVSNHIARQTALCFVPDVDLKRYQSHLRDAYHQGFVDGMIEARANLHSKKKVE